mmetsp:Transcript_114833/g.180817  ORF Transcript_114833/g.180817 Transcript_114833/m.180817 type:complete len:81 (-) Transcript_114833:180-422(-)
MRAARTRKGRSLSQVERVGAKKEKVRRTMSMSIGNDVGGMLEMIGTTSCLEREINWIARLDFAMNKNANGVSNKSCICIV